MADFLSIKRRHEKIRKRHTARLRTARMSTVATLIKEEGMGWTKDTRPEDLKLGEYLLDCMRGKKENDTTWIWPAVVLAATIILAVVLASCAQASAMTTECSYYTLESTRREGTGCNVGLTASGEILKDDGEYTFAHATLPFNTRCRITRVGREDLSIIARCNDRGPAAYLRRKGRQIDLNKSAAAALQILEVGVAQVTVTLAEAL